MTVVLGIDPGKTGALAVIRDGAIFDVIDMPTAGKKNDTSPALIVDWLEEVESCMTIDLVVLEFVRSRPGQSAPGVFGFGRGVGAMEGIFAAHRLVVEQPTPAKWKRDMRLSKDKGESRAEAIRLWPSDSERFKRVKDDGRAEACLLGEWGRRLLATRSINQGEQP